MALRQVPILEFYAALRSDPRDIMPTIVGPYDKDTGFTQEWRDQKSVTRELFGKSDEGGDQHSSRYWLLEPDPT